MRIRAVAWTLIVALLPGCAHVSPPLTLDAVSKFVGGESGTIEFVDGQTAYADYIQVSGESVSWVDHGTGDKESVPSSQVSTIRIPRRGRGALRGLGYGLLIGGSIGAGVGASNGGNSDFGGAGGAAVIGFVLLGIPFSLIGALAGSLKDADVYQVDSTAVTPLLDSDVNELQ